MPYLTHASRSSGSILRVQRVYEIIDGRAIVKAHGDREMPRWGVDYTLNVSRPAYKEYRHDVEVFVRSQIVALVNYLYTL
jgi:hypothetical protein